MPGGAQKVTCAGLHLTHACTFRMVGATLSLQSGTMEKKQRLFVQIWMPTWGAGPASVRCGHRPFFSAC
eukprot:1158786-Pelagomonas_calceolata.AAC.8